MGHKDKIRRSNIEDLLDDGIENNSDLRRRFSASSQSNSGNDAMTVARSTSDPLDINYIEVEAADKMGGKYLTRKIWRRAWLWLAAPPIIAALVINFTGGFSIFSTRVNGIADILVIILLGILLLVSIGYWPYTLLKRSKEPFRDDT